MASFDRHASVVARARLTQARAQQSLVERQLDQNRLTAPISGLVLSTNSEDTLGAPVTRGDTMLEIAPEEGFEVHLLVDETNIRDVFVEQHGELSLRARPDELLSFTVASIHPIAESGNGTSRFRVKAHLAENELAEHDERASMRLRPGESGRARLSIGDRTIARIFLGPVWKKVVELKWRLIG